MAFSVLKRLVLFAIAVLLRAERMAFARPTWPFDEVKVLLPAAGKAAFGAEKCGDGRLEDGRLAAQRAKGGLLRC